MINSCIFHPNIAKQVELVHIVAANTCNLIERIAKLVQKIIIKYKNYNSKNNDENVKYIFCN